MKSLVWRIHVGLSGVVCGLRELSRLNSELFRAYNPVGCAFIVLLLLEALSEHDLTHFYFHGLGFLNLHILHDNIIIWLGCLFFVFVVKPDIGVARANKHQVALKIGIDSWFLIGLNAISKLDLAAIQLG